jgi:hypothetical protein
LVVGLFTEEHSEKHHGDDGHGEFGKKRQAVLDARAILSAWATGFPTAVIYALRDDSNDAVDEEKTFGLIDLQYQSKPAKQAIETVTNLAKGTRFVGLISGLPSGLHGIRMEGQTEVDITLWNQVRGLERTVSIPVTNMTSLTGLLGEDLKPHTPLGRKVEITIREEDGPVYVRYRR